MKKARIIKLIGGLYSFKDLKTGEILEGYARGKFRKFKVDKASAFNKNVTMKTKKETKDIVLSPKVGDLIEYDFVSDQYMILDVFERKNTLTRPDITNVDQVLLVFSSVNPDFNFTLLDRFLVILEYHQLKPIVAVSKIDLMDEDELLELKNKLTYYEAYYDFYYINSKKRIGFDVLVNIFKDKITVLAGQTGVGKSTLMNALKPSLELRTQAISVKLGRGKHTTRHSEMFEFGGGYIADTPGFSRIDFEFYDENELKDYFVEFGDIDYLCKFKNKCYHVSEPGCMVKRYVDEHKILKTRYESYLSFYEELKQRKEKY